MSFCLTLFHWATYMGWNIMCECDIYQNIYKQKEAGKKQKTRRIWKSPREGLKEIVKYLYFLYWLN